MLTLVGIIAFSLLYVGIMNWLGGEKFLVGNKIRETFRALKQ